MFNEFLTQILQVVLILDVVGVIAYFVLSGLRTRNPGGTGPTAVVLAGAATDANLHDSRWWRRIRPWRGSHPALTCAPAPVRAPSLDTALGQLRRVLDGYHTSLA